MTDKEREQWERNLRAAMRAAWENEASELMGYLGNPPAREVSETYWTRFRDNLRRAIAPILAAIAQALAEEGGAGMNLDWNLVNQRAREWAENYAFNLVKGIEETTRDRLAALVSGFYADKEQDLKALGEKIGELFGAERGQTIATTEATRAAAEGQGVLLAEIKRLNPNIIMAEFWQTSADEIVCPICGALNGEQGDGQGNFKNPDTGEVYRVPAHPNCIVGDSRVLAFGISATSARRYEGDIIIIRTASGKHLTCTPNHPILTNGGWVGARFLDEGSYVIGSCGGEWETSLGNVYNENMPTRIQDIAEAFGGAAQMSPAPMPVSPEDFHGDGRGSQVAVVRTNCLLRYSFNPALHEHLLEDFFIGRGVKFPRLDGERVLDFRLNGNDTPARLAVRRRDLAAALPCGHSLPLDFFGGALIANVNASRHESATNDPPRNPEFFGEDVFGFPTPIQSGNLSDGQIDFRFPILGNLLFDNTHFLHSLSKDVSRNPKRTSDYLAGIFGNTEPDKIVSVECDFFHGFVYNLETESGAYLANGIVTHNCRCARRLQIVLPKEQP